MTERIGIFGGSFDPPHIGHLIIAEEAIHAFHLKKLDWLLTPHPPHKVNQPLASLQHRIKMLESCLSDNPGFNLSRLDIDRPGPHYAVDTVKILRSQNPSAQVVYIMGGDSLHDLPTWYKPHEFIQVCDLIGVMRRPGDLVDLDNLERIFPGLSVKVSFMDTPLIDISSHIIRQRIQENRPYRYFVPGTVYAYIEQNSLYR